MENEVKSYWDFTEKERSLLTQEQVENLFEIELMQKGVKKPVPPVLRIVEDIVLSQDRFYKVGHVLFKKHEEAAQFLTLNPAIEDYEWNVSPDHKFPEPISDSILEVPLYRKSEVDALRVVLAKRKEAKKYNDETTQEYRKSCDTITKTVGAIWGDWNVCRMKLDTHKKILNTWKDYMRITYNNNDMAWVFLKKIFNENDIAKAKEWLGENSFDLTIPQEELGPRKLIMETIKEGEN